MNLTPQDKVKIFQEEWDARQEEAEVNKKRRIEMLTQEEREQIFNELNEIVFTTNNLDFINLCNENHLPKRALLKSKYSDGEYKLYLKQSPKNNEFLKYKGWYCKYKK